MDGCEIHLAPPKKPKGMMRFPANTKKPHGVIPMAPHFVARSLGFRFQPSTGPPPSPTKNPTLPTEVPAPTRILRTASCQCPCCGFATSPRPRSRPLLRTESDSDVLHLAVANSKNSGIPKWLALVSGNMETKTRGLPLHFHFEPRPFGSSETLSELPGSSGSKAMAR